ncbi:MAG TPA: hypothetical protein VMU10_00105 [Desulfomonilia bacterium]|nr:hypothetical protein [Desulfomonilia bacterium]
MLTPGLFCLGDDMAGIYAHPTCTPEQFALLKKYLDRRPKITISRLPDFILIQSLIMIPRPSVVGKDLLNLILLIIPVPDAPIEKIKHKCDEVESLFRAKGIGITTHILKGVLPQLAIHEVMRMGVVLAGRHPVLSRDDEMDMSFFTGDIPDAIDDDRTLRSSEWNPFQYILDREMETTIKAANYHTHMSVQSANPFIAPYLPMLIRYNEEPNDVLLSLRLCIGALFQHFEPTRGATEELMRTWGLNKLQVPDTSNLSHAEAIHYRDIFVPLEEHELPLFSWPPKPSWQLEKVTLVWDGPGWKLAESGSFFHKHAWVVLAWASLSGLIGSNTALDCPEGLRLRANSVEMLVNLLNDISRGVEIITSSDPRQGSIRINKGRFFFSDASYAILEPGMKISLMLFEEIKKKALLDDSNL